MKMVLIAAALLSAGCHSQPPAEAKAPSVGWRPIGSWSGRGSAQTDSFSIESGQFRVKWETKNESSPGAGTFRVTAHSAISGRPIMLAVDHEGVGKDTAFVSDEPRFYHLVIESGGIDWSIAVDEAVVGIPQ